MAIIILGQRFEDPNDVEQIIAALQKLPVPEVDLETPVDFTKTLTVIQREMASVSAGDERFRFVGTREVGTCIFWRFTLLDATQQKREFFVHSDDSKSYDWDSFFQNAKGCQVTATLIGGVEDPIARQNLTAALKYLLQISTTYQLDITFETQCILGDFLVKRSDWPAHLTRKIQDSSRRIYQRCFNEECSEPWTQYKFGAECANDDYLDPEMRAAITEIEEKSINIFKDEKSPSYNTIKKLFKIDDSRMEWTYFILFLAAIDFVTGDNTQLFRNFKEIFVKNKTVFHQYLKKFFTPDCFTVLRCFEVTRLHEAPRFTDFVIDLHTAIIIPVLRHAPMGPFANLRFLQLYNAGLEKYDMHYTSELGFNCPNIPRKFIQRFRELSQAHFIDISNGVSEEHLSQLISEMGFGETHAVMPIRIRHHIGRLAHEVANSPNQIHAGLQSWLSKTGTTHNSIIGYLNYLNQLTGKTFYAGGGNKAIYAIEDAGEVDTLTTKLLELKLKFQIQESLLIISDLSPLRDVKKAQSKSSGNGLVLKF